MLTLFPNAFSGDFLNLLNLFELSSELFCTAKGVDPNLYNTSGNMPLHLAACVCDICDDDPEAQNGRSCTEKQYKGMLDDLLAAGADVNAVTYYNFDLEEKGVVEKGKKGEVRKKRKKGNGHSASDMAEMGGPNGRTGHDLQQVVLEWLMKHRVPFTSFKSSGFATVQSLYGVGLYTLMKECGVKNRPSIDTDEEGLVLMNQLIATGEVGCVFEWPGLRLKKSSMAFSLGVNRMMHGGGFGGGGGGGGQDPGCPTQ